MVTRFEYSVSFESLDGQTTRNKKFLNEQEARYYYEQFDKLTKSTKTLLQKPVQGGTLFLNENLVNKTEPALAPEHLPDLCKDRTFCKMVFTCPGINSLKVENNVIFLGVSPTMSSTDLVGLLRQIQESYPKYTLDVHIQPIISDLDYQ